MMHNSWLTEGCGKAPGDEGVNKYRSKRHALFPASIYKMVGDFCESVSPVAAIQVILHDYPFCASILRELLQNSDDARATKQVCAASLRKHIC